MLKVTALGRLTTDIEVKHLIGDDTKRVANFCLACRDNKETEFADFTAWNEVAETLAKYAEKGNMIYIEGRQKIKEYIDEKTNIKHKRVYTIVEKFEFVESKKKEQTLFDK